MVPKNLEPGSYVIYQNGESFELGQIKRRNNSDDGYFVYYHQGSTAANTPDRCLHELINSYIIKKTAFNSLD